MRSIWTSLKFCLMVKELIVMLGREKFYLITFDTSVKPFPKQDLVFTCLHYKSFENTVGKGEIAHNQQFPHFPQCFPPV